MENENNMLKSPPSLVLVVLFKVMINQSICLAQINGKTSSMKSPSAVAMVPTATSDIRDWYKDWMVNR